MDEKHFAYLTQKILDAVDTCIVSLYVNETGPKAVVSMPSSQMQYLYGVQEEGGRPYFFGRFGHYFAQCGVLLRTELFKQYDSPSANNTSTMCKVYLDPEATVKEADTDVAASLVADHGWHSLLPHLPTSVAARLALRDLGLAKYLSPEARSVFECENRELAECGEVLL